LIPQRGATIGWYCFERILFVFLCPMLVGIGDESGVGKGKLPSDEM